jgi:2-alkenal reductase
MPDMRAAIAAAKRSAIMLNAIVPPPSPDKPDDVNSIGAATVVEPGFAVVSNHVVEGATAVLYSCTNERGEHVLYQAKVVGRAPSLDIALLQLEDASIPAAELSTAAPQEGDPIVVVGAPWNRPWSTTLGFVTGQHRTLQDGGICDCMQVNGGINLGDSGGAAFDEHGRMSGMAEAVLDTANSLGFVIPADTLRRVLPLLHQGNFAPGPFGAQLTPVTMPWAAMHHTRALDGAVVKTLDGRAASSGLHVDDRLVAVNGRRVGTLAEAQLEIELAPEGQPMTLVVDRGGVITQIRAIR